MPHDDNGFLSRWSRLKRASAHEPEKAEAAVPAANAVSPVPATPAAEPEPELPDIASLTRDSDYTVFLRPGVPMETQREALRALWKSDPIFAHQDGLTDYADDFRNPSVVGAAVKTAWKLGRGFLDDPAEDKAVIAADDAAEAAADDAAEAAEDAPAAADTAERRDTPDDEQA